MSFSATLYNVSDDPRKINKQLGGGTTVSSIAPTENCDILNPTFILNYNEFYTQCNYIYVGSPFNRYYFITDMAIDIGRKISISCSVDPLKTYAADILSIETTIYRTEDYSQSAPYLADQEYQVKSGFQYYSQLFPTPFNGANGSYVLSWVGNERILNPNYVELYKEPNDWRTSWGDYWYKDSSGAVDTYYNLLTLYPNYTSFAEVRTQIFINYNSPIYAKVGGES